MQSEPQRVMDDIDLAAAIAAALQLKLHAAGITVDVSHGAVTLEGEADSEQQRNAAELVARRCCPNITNAVRVKRAESV